MASFLGRLFNQQMKCPTCEIYVTSEDMDGHLAQHVTPSPPIYQLPSNSTQPLHCPVCNVVMKSKNERMPKIQILVSHMMNHTYIECFLCSSKVRLDRFGTHLKGCRLTHGASVICPICNTNPDSVKSAKRHLKGHTTKFSCPYPSCSSFIDITSFNPHSKMHINNNNNIINRSTVHSQSNVDHIDLKSSPNGLEDESCGLTDLFGEQIEYPENICLNSDQFGYHFDSQPRPLLVDVTASHVPSPTHQLPSHPLHCPLCNAAMTSKQWERQKAQLLSHITQHTQVICILCSSEIRLDLISNHLKDCRVFHGASVVCPICNVLLSGIARSATKHLKMHTSKFSCPYPNCISSLETTSFHLHMKMHINSAEKRTVHSQSNLHHINHDLSFPNEPESNLYLGDLFDEQIQYPSTSDSCVKSRTIEDRFIHHYSPLHVDTPSSPAPAPSPLNHFAPPPSNPIHFLSCPLCNVSMTSKKPKTQKTQLVSHMKLHIQIICALCSSIIRLDRFGSHLNRCRVTHNASVICPICSANLPDRSKSANDHLKTHTSDFTCPYPGCFVSIKTNGFSNHLKKHLNNANETVHSQSKVNSDSTQTLNCPLCNVPMISEKQKKRRNELVSHMKLHVQVICALCSSNIRLDQIGSHLNNCRVSHGASVICPICSAILPDTGKSAKKHLKKHISQFRCPYPNCTSSIKISSFDEHMKMHLSCMETVRSQSDIDPNPSHHLRCPLCDVAMISKKRKIQKTEFVLHMVQHTQFKCVLCSSKIGLDQIDSHLNNCRVSHAASLVCPICNTNLPDTARAANNHLENHISQFSCPYPNCSSVIGNISSLYCHVRSHIKLNTTFHSQSNCDHTDLNLSFPQSRLSHPESIQSPPLLSDPPYDSNTFFCHFCETIHAANVDVISSHLLSCLSVPSDVEVVALADLVGLRIN